VFEVSTVGRLDTMRDEGLRTNPDSVDGASPPMMGLHHVNGTTLYAEVRSSGPAVLLIPGGAEDAEGWRAIAERLPGHTVVTYDRRGTLRSGREEWPGRGSAQHADDAAALLTRLGLRDVVVFGGSSAGIIAIQVALRHPGIVRRVLVFEPGYLRCVPSGERLQRVAVAAIETHLAQHPTDWRGAYGALDAALSHALEPDPGSLLAPRVGRGWYAERELANAEAFVRDDALILTAESIDAAAVMSLDVDIRSAHGTLSPRVFHDVAIHVAALRGDRPDVIVGAGHAIYLDPDNAARYLSTWID
jgi:pimeloyl-ACP methyl ester carboxylesterase